MHLSVSLFSTPYRQAGSITLALMMALERVWATCFPIYYRNNERYITLALSCLGWAWALIDSGFMFFGSLFRLRLFEVL